MSFLTQVEFGEGAPENDSGNVPALFFDAENGLFYFRSGGSGWQPVPDAADAQKAAKAKADAEAKVKADAEKAKAKAEADAEKAEAKAEAASEKGQGK